MTTNSFTGKKWSTVTFVIYRSSLSAFSESHVTELSNPSHTQRSTTMMSATSQRHIHLASSTTHYPPTSHLPPNDLKSRKEVSFQPSVGFSIFFAIVCIYLFNLCIHFFFSVQHQIRRDAPTWQLPPAT